MQAANCAFAIGSGCRESKNSQETIFPEELSGVAGGRSRAR